jgi:formate/nitrite transporter FocA (FNT family)
MMSHDAVQTPVIAGNIIGGSVLVALVYHIIYRRPAVKA